MRIELLIGTALDLFVGDPQWLPHPVRAIGWWAARLEPVCRAALPARLAGVLFWVAVVAPAAGAVWLTMKLLPWTAVYWIYALLAIRSLDVETTRAIRALEAGHLANARSAIGMVVGRDTGALDAAGVVRAAIETVAENLADAVVAPLFFLALAGPAGMMAYKAVNTLDSTVGYQSDRYRDFGWFSARADDWANWIPARLTAALIVVCAALPGFKMRAALRITLRDGASQPSPNSGWPEAAMAGALGVQLGGLNHYQGRPSMKPHLGDADVPLTIAAFQRARLVLYGTAAFAVLLAWSVLS